MYFIKYICRHAIVQSQSIKRVHVPVDRFSLDESEWNIPYTKMQLETMQKKGIVPKTTAQLEIDGYTKKLAIIP